MKLQISHETRYLYDAPVRSSTQYLRLMPRDTARQTVFNWKLDAPDTPVRTHDGYGNVLHVLTLDTSVSEIRIVASGVVETSPAADAPSDFTGSPLSPLLFMRATALTRVDGKLATFLNGFRGNAGSLAGLRELAAAIHDKMPFEAHELPISPGASEAFAARSGAGPDLAHVFIACARHLGIPARYVSGYLCTRAKSAARVATHAWVEAWVENRWSSFDLARNAPIGEGHVKLAMGADYLDACPIRGVRVGGGVETMTSQARLLAAAAQ
ncbi:MAG: transglutaminase family protein [Betaproteobacteria bacterium]|nr:transglutaminase family protein [Betaproteobacteria bacterium]